MVRLILLLMKILFLTILICTSFLFPSSSFASHIELKPCLEIAHCVREEWEVNNIEKPFEEIKTFIENTPRTVSYTHLTLPTSLAV